MTLQCNTVVTLLYYFKHRNHSVTKLVERATQPVRISKPLLEKIDKAVETIKDDFGIKKFSNRRDFIDEAVKDFLRDMEVSISG